MVFSVYFTNLSSILLYHATMVFAHYCETDLCEEDNQYCCGENICCNNTTQAWYYWAGVLLIIITICLALYLYLRKTMKNYIGYDQLASETENLEQNT